MLIMPFAQPYYSLLKLVPGPAVPAQLVLGYRLAPKPTAEPATLPHPRTDLQPRPCGVASDSALHPHAGGLAPLSGNQAPAGMSS